MTLHILRCDRPPTGWSCSRLAGHNGPCAASPVKRPLLWRLLRRWPCAQCGDSTEPVTRARRGDAYCAQCRARRPDLPMTRPTEDEVARMTRVVPPFRDAEADGCVAAHARIVDLEQHLVKLTNLHHRTLKGSQLHNPVRQGWADCECLTCTRTAELVPDQAAAWRDCECRARYAEHHDKARVDLCVALCFHAPACATKIVRSVTG